MCKGLTIKGVDTYTLGDRVTNTRNPVFHAHSEQTGKKVIIKGYLDPVNARRAFLRESRIAGRLHHACILPLLDVIEDTSGEYTVFPYIHGETLKSFLAHDGPIEGKHLLGIMPALCDALASIHVTDIVHADIKPANIFLVRHDTEAQVHKDDLYPVTGVVKPCLFDFDISYDSKIEPELSTDTIRGTAYYIAPENWYGERPSPSSDLYALGVTLYEMLTGTLPFCGDDVIEIGEQHCLNPIPDPRTRNPDISKELAMIIDHALEKNPYERYHSAQEFKEDILLAVV